MSIVVKPKRRLLMTVVQKCETLRVVFTTRRLRTSRRSACYILHGSRGYKQTTALWTAVLIRPWIGRKHRVIGFYLTQLLSDQSYIHKMGESDVLKLFELTGRHDTEHTFFTCEKWEHRRFLVSEIGSIAPKGSANRRPATDYHTMYRIFCGRRKWISLGKQLD